MKKGYTKDNYESLVFYNTGHNEKNWAERLNIPTAFLLKNNFQRSKKLSPKEVLLQVGLDVVSIGYFENPLNRVKSNFSFFSTVSLQTRVKVVRLYALIYETQINCLSIIYL